MVDLITETTPQRPAPSVSGKAGLYFSLLSGLFTSLLIFWYIPDFITIFPENPFSASLLTAGGLFVIGGLLSWRGSPFFQGWLGIGAGMLPFPLIRMVFPAFFPPADATLSYTALILGMILGILLLKTFFCMRRLTYAPIFFTAAMHGVCWRLLDLYPLNPAFLPIGVILAVTWLSAITVWFYHRRQWILWVLLVGGYGIYAQFLLFPDTTGTPIPLWAARGYLALLFILLSLASLYPHGPRREGKELASLAMANGLLMLALLIFSRGPYVLLSAWFWPSGIAVFLFIIALVSSRFSIRLTRIYFCLSAIAFTTAILTGAPKGYVGLLAATASVITALLGVCLPTASLSWTRRLFLVIALGAALLWPNGHFPGISMGMGYLTAFMLYIAAGLYAHIPFSSKGLRRMVLWHSGAAALVLNYALLLEHAADPWLIRTMAMGALLVIGLGLLLGSPEIAAGAVFIVTAAASVTVSAFFPAILGDSPVFLMDSLLPITALAAAIFWEMGLRRHYGEEKIGALFLALLPYGIAVYTLWAATGGNDEGLWMPWLLAAVGGVIIVAGRLIHYRGMLTAGWLGLGIACGVYGGWIMHGNALYLLPAFMGLAAALVWGDAWALSGRSLLPAGMAGLAGWPAPCCLIGATVILLIKWNTGSMILPAMAVAALLMTILGVVFSLRRYVAAALLLPGILFIPPIYHQCMWPDAWGMIVTVSSWSLILLVCFGIAVGRISSAGISEHASS